MLVGFQYSGSFNPAGMVARMNNRTNLVQPVGNVYGELEVRKGLKLRSSMGYDYNTASRTAYDSKYFIDAAEQNQTSTVTEERNNFFGHLSEDTLTYNNRIADHYIIGLRDYTEELYKGGKTTQILPRRRTPLEDRSCYR